MPGEGADASEPQREKSLGTLLRELRQRHALSLRELSRKAGVSASLLSEVERDRVEPSISTLKKVANVYGIALTYFFNHGASSHARVVRKDERRRWKHPATGPAVHFELLSPTHPGSIEALLVRYDPGASTGASDEQAFAHEGEEWGIVLSGRLKVIVGDESYVLEAGDAIRFPSTTPHRVVNIHDGPTTCIWVDTPPTF